MAGSRSSRAGPRASSILLTVNGGDRTGAAEGPEEHRDGVAAERAQEDGTSYAVRRSPARAPWPVPVLLVALAVLALAAAVAAAVLLLPA